ncbi:hypothetical protein ACHWQZ_G005932 [Mnemiopsis leidyi]
MNAEIQVAAGKALVPTRGACSVLRCLSEFPGEPTSTVTSTPSTPKVTTFPVRRIHKPALNPTVTAMQWRCNVCDRVFHGKGCKSQYNRHYKVVHLNIKPFRCDKCGKRFSQKCNRRQHMARHHGAEDDIEYALSMLRRTD